MKSRTLFIFLIALVFGVAAALMANNWIEERLKPMVDSAGAPVVVAALEIPFGTRIELAHVKVVDWPSGEAPKGSIADPAVIQGKISKQSLLPGEVILEERIVEHLGGSTLASIVERNKRAITVRVNDVIGVAGFLLPGNRVDILFTKRQSGSSVTQTILQDIKVLAVDQTASTDKDRPVVVRAVTMELTPAEAETLVKATSEGTLQLTLRNPLDSELIAKKEEEVKKAPVKKKVRTGAGKVSVTVIRGTDVSTTSLRNEPRIIR